jgi:hypothetical protein
MIRALCRLEGPVATTGLAAIPGLPPLDSIETPALDLSDLEDLSGTLRFLRDAGVLQGMRSHGRQ